MSEAKKHDVIQVQPQAELPAVASPVSLIEVIAKVASDPNADVGKLERMMDLYERVKAKEAEQAFNDALNVVQTEIKPVQFNANNSQTRSKYATYEALDDKVRPIYAKHGFSISFGTGDTDKPEHVRVTAVLRHKAGHKEPYHIDMPADGKGAKGGDVMTKTHATGSATTYGKRYLLILMFNIPVTDKDDDDGNRAGQAYLITAEQKEQIIALMKETEADTAKFLEYMQIDTLDELPFAKFNKAINMLNAKKKQAQGDKK